MKNEQGKATTRVNKNKQPKKGPRTSGAKPTAEQNTAGLMANATSKLMSLRKKLKSK